MAYRTMTYLQDREEFDHYLTLLKQAVATRRCLAGRMERIKIEEPGFCVPGTDAGVTYRRLSRLIALCLRRENRRHAAMGARLPLGERPR